MTRAILGLFRPAVSSVSQGRSLSLHRRTSRAVALFAASVAVGAFGWSGHPLTLPLITTFPAIWALSPSRAVAACVSAGYFLTASRGLPQGSATFYGSQLAPGIGLWFAASVVFVVLNVALWTARRGWHRPLRYAIGALLLSVPPFGIVGWGNPIIAAGVLFPGWAWFGLSATVMLMLVMTTSRWPVAVAVLGGLWACSAATWTSPKTPDGWAAVQTHIRARVGQNTLYEHQRALISLAKSATADGARVIVLPESAAGLWTQTADKLWSSHLEGMDVAVITGAALIERKGYDNAMVLVSAAGSEIIYRARMSVPVAMWQPWLGWMGQGGGARANFFGNPIASVDGERVAPLICYELLLVWPIIQSMLHRPDVIVAIGNGWWATGTGIVAIQRASAEAWSSLFGVPLAVAFNS